MRFHKPALSHKAQLEQLIRRGMVVDDRERALHYLRHINYYRLGAYWLPFEKSHDSHQFMPGTTLDQVLNLYIFDRELRLLLMDAIERIEVSVRAHWAYEMARAHGPHCHLDRDLFKPRWNYDLHLDKLRDEVQRSQETFIQHLLRKYDEPLPPVWAVVEIMTLGQLSKWYSNSRHRRDRNAVARHYGLDENILASVLHHLATIRNTCAHHARLWNRRLTVTLRFPEDPHYLAEALAGAHSRKLYPTLTLLLYLMDTVNPQHHWLKRLTALIDTHDIDPAYMGFPSDWRRRPMWNRAPVTG